MLPEAGSKRHITSSHDAVPLVIGENQDKRFGRNRQDKGVLAGHGGKLGLQGYCLQTGFPYMGH
ncbi:hypothetical protein VSS37_08510 [Candidatus Thiothrix sp. Deng01]|uniref:Uncharacterized protein n=1 Tax=Candidatus Thiothrix phosphatis TaxID=3112415 RepID=A0ABU6CW11_9GAMM|nr:hypothetical protein [Candidatus Thiothrix sp. Deng01]MEB4591015.1 hypothetical protein [Candidatus Thiothrix sp. Deng01]